MLALKVLDISEITELPEMLDGRVKTLHPRVHAAAAFSTSRGNAEHETTIKEHKIRPDRHGRVQSLSDYRGNAGQAERDGTGSHHPRTSISAARLMSAVCEQKLSRCRHRHRSGSVRRDRAGVESEQRRVTLPTRRAPGRHAAFARTAAYDAAIAGYFAHKLGADGCARWLASRSPFSKSKKAAAYR